MVQGDAILVVDFGNSSTKGAALFGRDSQTGKFRERQFEVPNAFAPIEDDYVVSADYNDVTSTILSLDTSLGDIKISGNYCNGELQEREKPTFVIKPSAFDKKYNLEATVLSLRMAFLQAYKAIMNMQRISDISQIDVRWKVVTLLPPGDIDEGRAPMEALIKDITSLDVVFPKMHVDIKVDKVTVLAEGFCGYVAVVYDKGQIFRRGYEYLKDESVMIFDIGAGTTDCMLIKNNKLVQNSKYTVEQGGINVLQLVRRQLRLSGLDLDEGDIQAGIIKGYVKDGSKNRDITSIVNSAKEEVAGRIVTEFQDYLSLTNIKMRSVGYIIICGGGSMSDEECPQIIPLSKSISAMLKRVAPNAELVSLPKVTVSVDHEDGTVTKEERTMSARMLNLIGASILAEVV